MAAMRLRDPEVIGVWRQKEILEAVHLCTVSRDSMPFFICTGQWQLNTAYTPTTRWRGKRKWKKIKKWNYNTTFSWKKSWFSSSIYMIFFTEEKTWKVSILVLRMMRLSNHILDRYKIASAVFMARWSLNKWGTFRARWGECIVRDSSTFAFWAPLLLDQTWPPARLSFQNLISLYYNWAFIWKSRRVPISSFLHGLSVTHRHHCCTRGHRYKRHFSLHYCSSGSLYAIKLFLPMRNQPTQYLHLVFISFEK